MNNHSLDAFEIELENGLGLSDISPIFVQSLRQRVMNRGMPAPSRRPLVLRYAAIVALTLTILFFAFGPQNVMAAVRQWLGQFLPGIGFVEDSNHLRILEKPATVKIDGAEVTIQWAYTDENQTVIAHPEESDSRTCQDWLAYSPQTHSIFENLSLGKLRLPDGRELAWDYNGGFEPMPVDINEATLIIYTNKEVPDCPKGVSCRCMDEDQRMEISIRFITPPAGNGLEIYNLQFTPVPHR